MTKAPQTPLVLNNTLITKTPEEGRMALNTIKRLAAGLAEKAPVAYAPRTLDGTNWLACARSISKMESPATICP